MEAELVRELPLGDGWAYEPKWDGFRGVLENAGGELRLWSRNGRPLLRYFPELQPLGELLPPRSAIDGEIVIDIDGAIDFDAMQTRLHPAESRIRKLSAEIPAQFIGFDVLLWEGTATWRAAVRRAPGGARARRGRLHPVAVGGRPGAGDRLARGARVPRPRRRRREAPRPAGRPRRPRRGRQGEARPDGRLRRRRRALEVEARRRSRRCCSGSTTTTARSTTSARPRSRRASTTRSPSRCCRCSTRTSDRRFSEPNRWGGSGLEEQPLRPGARRRGALRQGAGHAVPARHQAAALPAGQGSALVHLGRAAAAARARRADGWGSARR